MVTDYRDCYELRPATGSLSATGFIFVSGGFVDPAAYIEAMAPIVRAGYPVLIQKVPGNLAVLDAAGSLALRGQVGGITRWVVGGHSLGGAMAANTVNANPAAFAGLVLEAAYPPDSASLAAWTRPVLSLSAQNDGLATPAKINDTKRLLPAATSYHQIAGGCHAFFGSYGAQDGDGMPTITRAAQQAEAGQKIVAFLAGLGG